jgi:hypothetical protein
MRSVIVAVLTTLLAAPAGVYADTAGASGSAPVAQLTCPQ